MKKLIVLCLAMAGIFPAVQAQTVVIDSQVTLAEALAGSSAPQEVLDSLAIADVEYYSFDGKLHRGQIVMHKTLKEDVIHLFRFMRNQRFPIESAIPIRFDKPNDGTSMDTLNNSYSFHYRRISTSGNGSRSVHSYGMAIDINPYNNPAVLANGKVIPQGGTYDRDIPSTLADTSPVVKEFIRLGWTWGGNWTSLKDYMHFEKKLP